MLVRLLPLPTLDICYSFHFLDYTLYILSSRPFALYPLRLDLSLFLVLQLHWCILDTGVR